MERSQRMQKLSFRIAFGGIASALCVLMMLSASIIPLMTYIFPMLSGLLIYAVSYECGKNTGLAAYASVSALLLILSPEKESAFMFAFFFGYYPILSVSLDNLKSKAVGWVIRFLVFNISMVAAYFILMKLFVGYMEEDFTGIAALGLLFLGNILLILYEIMFRRLRDKYVKSLRKKLFKRK